MKLKGHDRISNLDLIPSHFIPRHGRRELISESRLEGCSQIISSEVC
ncbi:hypothetical protein J7L27_06450 [Candidatus Bathyarchaeota archaeon]|nr:hypothetical protein [Candidatus Bathyarchaeota archaeon]